jgi:hypothetical protein
MSNETDLDWLARNVHEWDGNFGFIVMLKMKNGDNSYMNTRNGSKYHPYCMGNAVLNAKPYSKAQWLARRAELQNKPSWDSAPSAAEWIAQHSSGYWCWGRGAATKSNNGTWYSPEFGIAQWTGYAGTTLGDWCDTLERRPADLSEMAVTQRLQEATENVLAAVQELKSDRYKFDPFISIEDNKELNMSNKQEVKQDNGWFERGELPPVGAACEFTLGANAPWYQCEIKYVIRGDGVVMKRIPGGDEQYCGLLHRNPVSFRPIRTEREVAIEEMCKDVDLHVSVFELEAGKLYDAGYRKDPK